MRGANEALLLARKTGIRCKAHLVADVLVVCQLLRAAACGAYHIAAANLGRGPDISFGAHGVKAPHDLHREGEEVFKEVEGAILSRVHGGAGPGSGNKGSR
jgi:hypothetical protein